MTFRIVGSEYASPQGPPGRSATIRLLNEFTAVGEVRLLGVRIDEALDLTGARVDSPAGLALDLTNAEIRSSVTLRSGVAVAGTLRLTGASIHGNLSLRGATLAEPEAVPSSPPPGCPSMAALSCRISRNRRAASVFVLSLARLARAG